jgi:hypothetical protein
MAKHLNSPDSHNFLRSDTLSSSKYPGQLSHRSGSTQALPVSKSAFGQKGSPSQPLKSPEIDVEQFAVLGSAQSTKELEVLQENCPETHQDLILDLDTQKEIQGIVSSLHSAIDAMFRRKAGDIDEQLYHLPEDYKSFSVKEKIKLARDIADQLSLEVRNDLFYSPIGKSKEDAVNKKPDIITYQTCSKGDVNIMKLNQDKEDVLYKVYSFPPKGLRLTNDELRDIAALLLGALRDSASHELKEKMRRLQNKYERVSENLVTLNARLRELQDEEQVILNENDQLKAKLKLSNQQIQSLEKQLEDAIVEAFIHQEKSESLSQQLAHSRRVVEQLISKVPSDDICLLLEAEKSLPNKLCKDSPMPSNIRYIYNSTDTGMKKSSIGGEDLYIIKSSPSSSPSTPQFLQRKVPIHNTVEEEITEDVKSSP